MGGPVRPSSYIGWGSTGATNVTEPLDSKKAVGWATGEKPGAGYFNWLLQKQDQWIQYLAWLSSLDPIVEEDFIGDSLRQPLVNAATGFAGWYKSTGIASLIRSDVSYLDSGLGYVTWTDSASGAHEYTTRIGRLRARDFKMEFVIGDAIRGHSGGSVAYGLFHTSGISGAFPRIGFVSTGASGTLGVQWQPSGAASPTSVALGVAMSPTALHKLTIENRNPTMAIYYEDVLQTAVPSPGEVGASGIPMDFGLLAYGVSPTGFGGWIDKMYLGVRRNPT